MSQVVSFRLDPENNRERTALEVIDAWQGRGFSVRQIMTEALLKLEMGSGQEHGHQFDQMNEKLDHLSRLLGSMNKNQLLDDACDKRDSSIQELSQGFVAAMKFSAKPGLRVS